MDATLQARCDQQIKNEKALRDMSTLESEASIKVGSLLYTALELPVSDDTVYASKKILENKEGIFANFRGVMQSLLLLRMAVVKDQEAYIDSVISTYDKLEKGSGISGLYAVLAAVIITEQHGEQDLDSVTAQVLELFGNIQKLHPERSNASELAYVALMLLAGKADTSLEEEKVKIFQALKAKLQLSDDTARATSLVLMTNSKSAEVKVDEFAAFYEQLQATGHATAKNQYISVYGAFADLTYLNELGVLKKDVIAAIGDVDDYLKGKTGYGMLSIRKDMRKVLAASLVLQHCTITIPKEKHADFDPDVSIELLLFVVLMSLAAID